MPKYLATTVALVALMSAGVAARAEQKQDLDYNKLIAEHLVDKRITTELVDHMPASDTVPSPLKFFGRIPGTPGELTYAKDIQRYYETLAKASPRAKFLTLGKTEEGRDLIVLAIADEAVLKDLDKNKADLAALSDPRKTSEEQARALIKTAKPIYWLTSGIHSPETGGPETLIELAYRLIVEDTPFIENIRKNSVVFITPVVEVDGHEKHVDTYYYGKKTNKPKPPLMYWGRYVAHDNNRDGMGQFLKLTQAINAGMLDWHPTVLHDLHEAQSYLYASTGTGPYNPSLDAIATNEWWLLAQTEVMEMAKRGVPGVWTYGFYDGWVPNYLFWIAVTHNSFGRFYEVQSYGPDINKELKLPPTVTSREWYRPNPALPSIAWGPRNTVNIQESALLFALNKVASDHELYLENYWMKNQRAIDTGKKPDAINAWVVPAKQTAKLNVADMLNTLRKQGAEVSVADGDFTAGNVKVAAGDYVIRADQPYRTLLDMYLGVQVYPAANPRPYDDTGWTMQYMRNVDLKVIHDPAVLTQKMTLLTADIAPKGTISGPVTNGGNTILFNHTGDNQLVALRFKLPNAKMQAAEEAFEADGRKYAAGTFILVNVGQGADRGAVEKVAAELGVGGEAVASAPTVKSHPLTTPRIGYLHSWLRTQDEGWWRAALDHYGVPYTYFADIKVREGNLRKKYDVLIYPTVNGTVSDAVNGVPLNGNDPIPYKKSDVTPNLGVLDQADDIRGGLGVDGIAELKKFVEAGGTLIGDGTTVELLAQYGVASGVTVTKPTELFSKGSIMRGVFTDQASPLAYGYEGKELPVYFSEAPVLTVGRGAGINPYFDPNAPGARLSQNVTPNAVLPAVSAWKPDPATDLKKPAPNPSDLSPFGSNSNRRPEPAQVPRTVMQFPAKDSDILLSGLLVGGQTLTNKALIVDVPSGKGHMVMYAMRPFWRWQTQGSYFLGFNAILNWDQLDAGKPAPKKDAETPAKSGG